MATNPRIKLGLTRDQLATFLKDHEQIKQFENLFAVADAIAPDVVQEINIAGNLKDMYQGIEAIGAELYNMGAKSVGSVLIQRMKVAGS